MPKYVIRTDRYIDGVYHRAAPDAPKVVEIHERFKPHLDHTLVKHVEGEEPAPEKLGQHFADAAAMPGQTAAQVYSEPEKVTEPVKPVESKPSGKGKRAADGDPI